MLLAHAKDLLASNSLKVVYDPDRASALLPWLDAPTSTAQSPDQVASKAGPSKLKNTSFEVYAVNWTKPSTLFTVWTTFGSCPGPGKG